MIIYRRSGNFRCKNIFVVCANHENKKHEIYFTTDIHYSQNIFSHNFTAQLASYFAREGLFDTSMPLELVANVRQLFAQCPINRLSLLPQYVPTELFGSILHASSSSTAAW